MLKRAHEENHGNSERWLLTYADLITLLLVFFVVMYSISKADDRKFAKLNASLQKAFNVMVLQGQDTTAVSGKPGGISGNSVFDDFITVREELLKSPDDLGYKGSVNVTLRKEGIGVSLSGNLLFDSGRAELKPGASMVLNRLAQQLRRSFNEIRVEGHTDNIPAESDLYPTNWELSSARATAVSRYLIEVGRIEPERISATGFGEYRPVADNKTRESRSLNRRVDIVIVYPEEAMEGAGISR